ncbi:MAG: 3-oxoacyl-ACP reductase FabG [Desulfobacter sp.]|nr:3-oxoacyl-ACP reductase FabG [Desulfobacter sp.]
MKNANEKSQKKIALVTGASRGIGRAIAKTLAQTNCFVYINYNSSKTEAQTTLEQVRKAGSDGALIPFDVTDQNAVQAQLKTIFKEKGQIDVLVNNAGIRDDKLMVMMKNESWQRVMDTNLTGFFNVTKLVVKKMLSKRWGRVINIASASGQVGHPGQVNYSASKAGLIGATMALAKEVASRNITVNAVAPGFIETEMVQGLPLEQIAKDVPAGRLGKPQEVAAAVSFLSSHEAGYITGQILGVNGGVC